jgi:hypothetical protein
MTETRSHGWRTSIVCVPVLTIALGLSACSSFDSSGGGESLIKDFVKKHGNGVAVKAVSCPNVSEKKGATYTCNLTLHRTSTGQDVKYTAKIHMDGGGKIETTSSDFQRVG